MTSCSADRDQICKRHNDYYVLTDHNVVHIDRKPTQVKVHKEKLHWKEGAGEQMVVF